VRQRGEHSFLAVGEGLLPICVLWCLLRIFHEDIEVAIIVEDSGIQQLVFHFAAICAVC
jgi:hypothetical protein